jgi:hypothetical protein
MAGLQRHATKTFPGMKKRNVSDEGSRTGSHAGRQGLRGCYDVEDYGEAQHDNIAASKKVVFCGK